MTLQLCIPVNELGDRRDPSKTARGGLLCSVYELTRQPRFTTIETTSSYGKRTQRSAVFIFFTLFKTKEKYNHVQNPCTPVYGYKSMKTP